MNPRLITKSVPLPEAPSAFHHPGKDDVTIVITLDEDSERH